MLRPATPLTVLLFISFVLLLLSTLSTPIITGIPIATFKGINFGVFGYCVPGSCSGIRIGYTTDGLFSASDNASFNLPSSTRHSLSSLLVVHPVAAFMNLVALALAAAAHLHSPSHSARYLLGLLILLLPTLLVTLLAFLVDILLFVPYMQWGGWIVLASTILITASGVVTCAMRRTLVSRKARKKRIAENAEMSGENFYARQAQDTKMAALPTFTPEDKTPMVNGAPGADNLPNFTTHAASRRSEENAAPTGFAAGQDAVTAVPLQDGDEGRYYGHPQSNSRPSSRPPPNPPLDQYGNPIPLVASRRSNEERRGLSPYGERLPPNRGYGPRGRGGYPPRGGYPSRGGYGPRGPPPQSYSGRGGYPGRGRGGYPPGPVMAGGMGPPPPGYPPQDRGMEPYNSSDEQVGLPSASPTDPYMPYSPIGPPQNQGRKSPYGQRAQSPSQQGRKSPYGQRSQSPAHGYRSSPQPRDVPPMPQHHLDEIENARMLSRTPVDNVDYIPPRANWAGGNQGSPVSAESPGHQYQAYHSPVTGIAGASHASGHNGAPLQQVRSSGSDIYYEDVDPRFAADPEPVPSLPPQFDGSLQQSTSHLAPPNSRQYGEDGRLMIDSNVPPTRSYEDLLPGARSPADSEHSNFTSVSQRGVNPNWRPGHGGDFNNLPPMRRPPGQTQMRRDMILNNNPDFEIPGMPPNRASGPGIGAGGAGRGRFRGSANGGPQAYGTPGRLPPASALGTSGDGRYPMASPPLEHVGTREI